MYADFEQSLSLPLQAEVRVSGSRSSTGILLRDSVVEVRSDVRALFALWSRLVVDERRLRGAPSDVAGMSTFLRRHLTWLSAHDVAADFAREILELENSANRCEAAARRRIVHIGPCVENGCDGYLSAVFHLRERHESEIFCNQTESHRWTARHWLRLGRRLGRLS